MLKSAAYIRASAGGVGAQLRHPARQPAGQPALDPQPADRRRRRPRAVLDQQHLCRPRSQRPALSQEGARDRATSSSATSCSREATNNAVVMAAYPVSAINAGFGRRHRRQHQSRLDVEAHEQSRRPARHFRRAGRQHRHRAGGAAGPGQHDRQFARRRCRCCRRSPSTALEFGQGRGIAVLRRRRRLAAHGQLRAHRRHRHRA